jgi:polar amino acid transport system substrate-binding protein
MAAVSRPARLGSCLLVVWLATAAALPGARAADHAPGRSAPVSARAAATGAPGSVVTVGVKQLAPFVVRDGGRFSGFSIELWDEIARRNGWRTAYRWYPDLPSLLDGVTGNGIDAAVAGISITAERENGSTSPIRCSTPGSR